MLPYKSKTPKILHNNSQLITSKNIIYDFDEYLIPLYWNWDEKGADHVQMDFPTLCLTSNCLYPITLW